MVVEIDNIGEMIIIGIIYVALKFSAIFCKKKQLWWTSYLTKKCDEYEGCPNKSYTMAIS